MRSPRAKVQKKKLGRRNVTLNANEAQGDLANRALAPTRDNEDLRSYFPKAEAAEKTPS